MAATTNKDNIHLMMQLKTSIVSAMRSGTNDTLKWKPENAHNQHSQQYDKKIKSSNSFPNSGGRSRQTYR